MNHSGTITLETTRLILRRFSVNDADAMFNNWASDPDVTKFMTWPPYTDVNEVRQYIESLTAQYDNDKFYYWAIVLKDINQPIGAISIVDYNEPINKAVIGYCIGKDYWHKGITTEAFERVIQFLFEVVGVNRIEATHDTNNPHSGMVMKKCGLTYEGTNRQSAWNNQGVCDSAVYAYLKEEYFQNKKL